MVYDWDPERKLVFLDERLRMGMNEKLGLKQMAEKGWETRRGEECEEREREREILKWKEWEADKMMKMEKQSEDRAMKQRNSLLCFGLYCKKNYVALRRRKWISEEKLLSVFSEREIGKSP
jgi:hypothetical protein